MLRQYSLLLWLAYTHLRIILISSSKNKSSEVCAKVQASELSIDSCLCFRYLSDKVSDNGVGGPANACPFNVFWVTVLLLSGRPEVRVLSRAPMLPKISWFSAVFLLCPLQYHSWWLSDIELQSSIKAIFRAAERDDAVLFLDESDSLLSKVHV